MPSKAITLYNWTKSQPILKVATGEKAREDQMPLEAPLNNEHRSAPGDTWAGGCDGEQGK
jgi:hypothetical protein